MSPIFTVTKGSLDATELAALTALVAATSQAAAAQPLSPRISEVPLCGAWGRPEEKFTGLGAGQMRGLSWA